MKRLMDFLLSGAALLVFSPAMLPLMVVLRLTGEGKIFYRQQRVGKDGREFGLFKFATMLEDSPNIGTGLLTIKEDPRVLPVGRFLRKTKINELPQLINIFLGDMSIIGPRPQTQEHVGFFPDTIRRDILKARPGLSGVGSIVFRDEETIMDSSSKGHKRCFAEDITPYKGELELWYIKHQSMGLDFMLIFITLWIVLFPESRIYHRWLKELPEPPESLIGLV